MANYEFLNKSGLDELVSQIAAKYATQASIPTAVSDLTNDSNFQTDTEVSASIASAIAGVTQFDYSIVQALPASGEKGVIYLVANSGSGTNIYDEYIWIETTVGTTTEGHFELFGTTPVTVVEYVGDATYIEVVNGTGANAGKKVVQLVSGKASLLDSALQGVTSTGSTIVVSGSGTTKNVEVSEDIVNGAAAGATALQSSDFEAISNSYIDGLFA